MHAIVTENLSRSYRSYKKREGILQSFRGLFRRDYHTVTALDSFNLEIASGGIVGIVGANGAGKTTLLKLLSGLIHPSSGDAQVLGFRPWKRQYEYQRQMSILLGQKNQLWWDIPAADSFELLARIYNLDRREAAARVKELSEQLGCDHLLHVQLRRLSLGERMKMELVGSLLHRPKVLFLDEPTLGLDVVAQSAIRNFFTEYVKSEAPTILLTSHYMDDISRLSERLLLMSHGRLVYDGTVREFVSQADLKQSLTMLLERPLPGDIALENGLRIEKGEQTVQITLGAAEVPRAIAAVTAAVPATEIRLEEADFEDVIREFLEKESRVRQARRSD
jgi:ABC-2 type transport system ATP-binding protein